MREALRLAAANDPAAGGPFGAVVARAGRILGRGQNAVVRCRDPSAHAEIVAIREACRQLHDFSLRGCELYSSCEPCPMCLGAVYWARIDRVYYAASRDAAAAAGFDDAFFYAELARPPPERRLPLIRMLAAEGGEPFRRWQSRPDKVCY